MREYRHILIVRTDRIGDVILTTPAIRALRQRFPQAKITVLVSPVTRPLIEGAEEIDQILVDDRKGEHRGLKGYMKLIRQVRQAQFDLAVVFHTKRRTNLLCFLARIPCRVGYSNEKFGFLLTERVPDNRSSGTKHEAQYCVDLVARIGAGDVPLKTFVCLQGSSEKWVEDLFTEYEFNPKQQKIIVIHPGASCPTKMWPVERFIKMMRAIQNKYSCRFILVGSRQIEQKAGLLMDQFPMKAVNLIGKTSVSELVSLFFRCSLVISNDSGPVHIAAAVGTPVVSIFTRNQPGINPERWRPIGERVAFVAPEPYEDPAFAKSRVSDLRNLERVAVEDVLEAVDALLKA